MTDLAPFQKLCAELDTRVADGTLTRDEYFRIVREGRLWMKTTGHESFIDIFIIDEVPPEWFAAFSEPLPDTNEASSPGHP